MEELDNDQQGNPQNEGIGQPGDPESQPSNEPKTVDKSVYDGLQRRYQRSYDQNKAIEAERDQLAEKVASLESMINNLDREKSALTTSMADLQSKVANGKSALGMAQSELAKWDLVRKEFPHMAKVAHLVPAGEPDTMRDHFKEMGSLVKTLTDEQVTRSLKGTLPPAGGGRQEPAVMSDKNLWDKLESLDPRRDSAEYRTLSDEWDRRDAARNTPGD